MQAVGQVSDYFRMTCCHGCREINTLACHSCAKTVRCRPLNDVSPLKSILLGSETFLLGDIPNDVSCTVQYHTTT